MWNKRLLGLPLEEKKIKLWFDIEMRYSHDSFINNIFRTIDNIESWNNLFSTMVSVVKQNYKKNKFW